MFVPLFGIAFHDKSKRFLWCAVSILAAAICSSASAAAQNYHTISTYAGPAPPVPGIDARGQVIGRITSTISDGAGGVYVATGDHRKVYRIDAKGVLTIVAGNLFVSHDTGVWRIRADGTSTQIASLITLGFPILTPRPSGLALDALGNIYVSDPGTNQIVRIRADDSWERFAGRGGLSGFGGDGALAIDAQFNGPDGLAWDGAGSLYVADTFNHRIRRISPVADRIRFNLSARAGFALQTSGRAEGRGEPAVTGYGAILPIPGGRAPAGLAIFGFRQGGVLVTEASLPATPLIREGRVFAQTEGSVRTGLAIANPSDQAAAITFFFTDERGDSANGTLIVPAREQVAAFLDQAPFNGGVAFTGTLTLRSTSPIAAIALRGNTNERSEFLITTLPVTDLNAAPTTSAIVFPHFADGAGWRSEIILLNPGSSALTGTIQFFDSSGQPTPVDIDGQTRSSLTYSLVSGRVQRLKTAGLRSATSVGYVRVVPASGTATPSGVIVFSFRSRGITVSEAAIPAVRAGVAFQLYAEVSESSAAAGTGSIQSGIAIANSSAAPTTIAMELVHLDRLLAIAWTVLAAAPMAAALSAQKTIPPPSDVAAPPKDAQRSASGLAWKVLTPGKGKDHPGPTSQVSVHYTGWTTDGKMFDSSVVRGQPSTFPLNGVIKGWTEGVQLMVVGEKRRFWIPGSLAYDNSTRAGVPKGMLVFDVELLAIK